MDIDNIIGYYAGFSVFLFSEVVFVKKSVVLIGGILLLILGMFIFISPDGLSLGVVAVMGLIVLAGFIFGITPNLIYMSAFKQGVHRLEDLKKVNSSNPWIQLSEDKQVFSQNTLDNMFNEYIEKAMQQREKGVIISDIENIFNEDTVSLRSWRGVVIQISGTLTALGLLGTFLGLVTGISGITFANLEDTVNGIESLLRGITTAFYTSIVGVILSITFNAVYRVIWNMTMRSMNLFIERFHLDVQPRTDELIKAKEYLNTEKMLGYLSRIQDLGTKFLGASETSREQEQRIMMELLSGEKKGELTYVFEPVCELSNRNVIKAEVSLRWNHEQLGTISPSIYMPVVLSNGYIVKLDEKMWDTACDALAQWYNRDVHPIPLVFKVSKNEMMSVNIPEYMTGLIEKHGLTPRDIEISLDADGYILCRDETLKTEQELLKKGFKVSVYGFDGDYIDLDLSAVNDALKLDEIFDQAINDGISLTASKIESAKQLADLKKFGCNIGKGEHLYKQLTKNEFEELMNYQLI